MILGGENDPLSCCAAARDRPEKGDDAIVCGGNGACPIDTAGGTVLHSATVFDTLGERHEVDVAALHARGRALVSAPACAQGTAADYERAESLRTKYFGLVEGAVDEPVFTEDSRTLVYRKSLKGGGNQFVEVDLATLTKKPAFDHAALAQRVSQPQPCVPTAAAICRSRATRSAPIARRWSSISRASNGAVASSTMSAKSCEAIEREKPPEGMGPRRPIGSGPPERDVTDLARFA